MSQSATDKAGSKSTRAYIHWLSKWRLPIIILFLSIFIFLSLGIPRLQFTVDYRAFFHHDNPELKAFEKLQEVYGDSDNVLIVVAPDNRNIFTKENLGALHDVTEQAASLPFSVRVDSIQRFKHAYDTGTGLAIENLFDKNTPLNPQNIQKIKQVAVNEPRLVNRLISATGHVAGVNITTLLPGENIAREVPEAASKINELVSGMREKYPDIRFYTTGILMMNNALTEVPVADTQLLMPVLFFTVFILISLSLRWVTGSLITFIILSLSVIGAMGLAGWLGILLTPPSAVSPIIILPLAVANCIHLLVNYRQNYQDKKDCYNALAQTLSLNKRPIVVTNITTIIGFLGLNFSASPPFSDLGNIVSIGIFIAFILSLVLVPVLVLILPEPTGNYLPGSSKVLNVIAEFVEKRHVALFWGMLLVTVVLLFSVFKNKLNDEFLNYFSPQVDFRSDTEFIVGNLTGLYLLEYSIHSNNEGGVVEPVYLEQLNSFANWYRKQADVMHVRALTDTVINIHNVLNEKDNKSGIIIPETRKLAAQELLLYEISLPSGSNINDEVAFDKSATRMTVSLMPISSNDLLRLEQRAKTWLEQNAPVLKAESTGSALMFANIGKRNIESMLTGTTFALIGISFLLIVALGSFKYGIISLIPNLLPAVMAFGIWGLMVGQIGMALSVVTCLTLGIVVDDTVHFISKYQYAKRHYGFDEVDAVRYAIMTVGKAIWVTSLVLVVAFSVLLLSLFVPNANLGLLTIITIICAMIADLLFLPSILILFDKSMEEMKAKLI